MSEKEPPPVFNPSVKTKATHDLRTNKEEAGKEELLTDLSEEGELPEMISITLEEYEKLQKWKPFEFLTFDVEHSNLTKESAHSLLKLTKKEQKQMGIRQEALKLTKIEETRESSGIERGQTQSKPKTPWIKIGIFSGITLIMGLVLGLISAPKKTPMSAPSNAVVSKGMDSWESAINNYIPLAEKEIVWVCSNPQQYENTLLKIKESVGDKSTSAILITQKLPVKTQTWLAQKYKILVINLDRSIGQNNWMILDQHMLINGSSNTLTSTITNKESALALRQYVDTLVKQKHTIQRP